MATKSSGSGPVLDLNPCGSGCFGAVFLIASFIAVIAVMVITL